jgi:hypothetical protein
VVPQTKNKIKYIIKNSSKERSSIFNKNICNEMTDFSNRYPHCDIYITFLPSETFQKPFKVLDLPLKVSPVKEGTHNGQKTLSKVRLHSGS